MNIIIIGAGNVGYTVGEALSSMHNVLMIETNAQKAEEVKSLLDVSVMQDDGVNPRIIEDAIKRHSAEVIITCMSNDDENIFACMVAKDIDPKIRTIAKIRNPDYIRKKDDSTFFGADQIISPELTSAKKIVMLATLENAVDYDFIESLDLAIAVFLVTDIHKNIMEKAVANIELPDNCSIVAVYRKKNVILFKESTQIHRDDLLCIIGSPSAISEFNIKMGVAREFKEIVILGGGIIGSTVAGILEGDKKYVKLIENNPDRCRKLARQFNNVLIINANGVDPNTLRAENVGRADVMISATESDEKNLLTCLVSLDLGTLKVISRYTKREYEDIFAFTGVKSTVGYHRIISNEITKTLISDETAIIRMKHDGETFFSVTVGHRSKVKGMRVGDISMPEGAMIACIVRGESKIYPRLSTTLEENDKVLLFTYEVKKGKIERLFGTKMLDF